MNAKQLSNAVRRLISDVGLVNFGEFMTMCEADARGRGISQAWSEPFRPGQLINEGIRTAGITTETLKPLLAGRDLIALGEPPGPRIGQLLRRIELKRDAGTIATRSEALTYLHSLLDA